MLLTLQAVERITRGDSGIVKVRRHWRLIRLSRISKWRVFRVVETNPERLVAAAIAAGWAIASGIGFTYSFIWDLDFAFKLTFWMIFFLAAFHVFFALHRRLTTRLVKEIDYYYLGIAAVGVLFFSIGYSDQRSAYLGQLGKETAASEAASSRATITRGVDSYVEMSCQLPGHWAAKHCENAKLLSTFTRKAYSATELQATLDVFNEFVLADSTEGPGKDLTEDQNTLLRVVDLVRMLSALQTVMKFGVQSIKNDDETPVWVPPPRSETGLSGVLYGLGQTILWPFMLALALALRIAKVTVEVRKWARD